MNAIALPTAGFRELNLAESLPARLDLTPKQPRVPLWPKFASQSCVLY